MNRQKMHDDIVRRIKNDQWSVVCVGAEPTFGYTIGLNPLPELICVGLLPDVAAAILNNCAEETKRLGGVEHGHILDNVANMPTTIINVHEDAKRRKGLQIYHFYQTWDFQLQQVVYPDMETNFPWEPDYDMPSQTVLGNPPREKMN